MATTRGVRIVSSGKRHSTDVFDLETGDKLLYVYSVHIEQDATTGVFRTQIVSGDAFEYEGPAEIVTPDEAMQDAEPETTTVTINIVDLIARRVVELLEERDAARAEETATALKVMADEDRRFRKERGMPR
jgi:hypothetical protein